MIREIGEIIGDIGKFENLPTYSHRYGWSRDTPKKVDGSAGAEKWVMISIIPLLSALLRLSENLFQDNFTNNLQI